MQWASSYDELRELLYEAGLFDVRVVPGMTVPDEPHARVLAAHEGEDRIGHRGVPGADDDRRRSRRRRRRAADTRVYEVAFQKLGENMLTITHDGGRKTYLEFFVTEPLETLIKKRAAFLVNRQQIKDPTKWWNGVYGIYDMKAKVTRTIDDPDIFLDRMVYALTCDDPGLSKAPYLAEKNVTFPDQTGDRVARVLHQELRLGRPAAQRRRAAVSVRRVRHAELVRQSRSGAAQGLRRAAGQRRDGARAIWTRSTSGARTTTRTS